MSTKKLRSNEKKYSPLGMRINVLLKELTLNQLEFSNLLSISNSYVSDLRNEPKKGKAKKGGLKFWSAIERELPAWKSYLEGKEKEPPLKKPVPYEQIPERMGIPSDQEGHDADWAEAGRSDIERHRVVEVVEPDYIRMTRDILESGYTATADALKSNIVEFHDRINDKRAIADLHEKIKTLEKGLRRAQNFECGSAEDADDADVNG